MNDTSDKLLKLEEFLPYRLSILSNTVSGAIAEMYARKYSLSIPEWRVMAVIARADGLSARQVAERTAMDKVAVSRAVRRLEKSGRLTRTQASEDKRRSQISLTPLGWQDYRKIVPLATAYETRLLEGMTASDKHQLNGLLDKLMARAKSMEAPA